MSLLFGVGQIVLGGYVAWRIARTGRWRVFGQYLILLVAVWFTFSGVSELLVSGMEAAHNLTRHPSAVHFTVWRSRIDVALLVASCLLLITLALYPLARRLRSTPSGATPPLDGEHAS